MRPGPGHVLVRKPTPAARTEGGLELPEVSKPIYHYGIMVGSSTIVWFIPHAEHEIEVIGDDGLPTGEKLYAVSEEAIIGNRAVPDPDRILAPAATAPDRDKEKADRARMEAD
jgi:hypothetical protein